MVNNMQNKSCSCMNKNPDELEREFENIFFLPKMYSEKQSSNLFFTIKLKIYFIFALNLSIKFVIRKAYSNVYFTTSINNYILYPSSSC